MSSDELFNTVYYGALLVGLIMGFVSLIVAIPRIKFNFPEEKLKTIDLFDNLKYSIKGEWAVEK